MAEEVRVPRGERALVVPSIWTTGGRKGYYPDDVDPSVYTDMLRRDGHCRQALRWTQNQVLTLLGQYQHPDDRIREAVAFALRAMEGTWRGTLRNILDAIWYGFDVEEIVWDRAPANPYGLRWTWRKLKPTPAESWYPKGLQTDDYGNLIRLVQWEGTAREVVLDLNRAIHYAFEGRGNPWGAPCARLVRRWYETRRDAHDMWLVGIERLSAPLVVYITPQGSTIDRATGMEKSYAELAADGWRQVSSGGVLITEAFFHDTGQNVVLLPQFEVLRGDGWQDEFANYCDYAAREIYLALGIPPLLQMEPQHSSRAQAQSMAYMTQLMLIPMAEQFAETVIVNQIARPLIEANFGPQETYGSVPVDLPGDEETTASVVRDLWQAGFTWATSEAHYRAVQRRLPSILPEWEEFAADGDFGVAEEPPR